MPITILNVYNLTLEGPSLNPTAVTFTGLPHIYRGAIKKRYIKSITHTPYLQVTITVDHSHTRFYGFSKLAGKTIILVPAYIYKNPAPV